ncbi:sulfotransferase [Streptomyces sp. 6N223]|uniref:sulfotransferase n=1 Tax=Streptomyces sp. 6N223 TaxID=3457412 RepID=UPI003FD42E89
MRSPAFPLTFVVGTGRSGSTTLSRILNLHPDALSLNELLASLVEPSRALPPETMTGAEFWRILAEPSPFFDRMIRSGAPLPEFLDPRPGIPALGLMVLPHLTGETGETGALHEELGREIATWPRRPAREHHLAFFDWLRARFGRTAVIERSGYSVHWIPALREAFPTARFVHLHREGPDCAVSMSRHPGYRLIAQLHEMYELLGIATLAELTEDHVRSLPPDLAALLGDRFDASLIWDRDIPITRFGALWSQIVTEGVEHLSAVLDEQRTTLSYEDLLDATDDELARLAAFAGLDPSPAWLDAARPLLDATRRELAARSLPPKELAELRAACEPGTAALAA